VKSKPGVEIELITGGSIAERAGLLPKDKLIRVNGNKIKDAIDLLFFGNEPDLQFTVGRGASKLAITACRGRDETVGLGIGLKPFHTRSCRNNCIFCFVSQLPKGLRKSLYLKDDDYRMSFLYGNYITMTNLSPQDKQRIIAQHLSPLYISVHSTNTAIRNKLLGIHSAENILKEIKFLADNKIRMHTQIVLCPGYNDGKDLEKTVADLYHFYPYVQSIAVVPVGLTAHRKKQLEPLDMEDALRALDTIRKFQNRFRRKHGENIVYGADELYIKAAAEFPPLDDYGELPQIENGVGMVPLFLHQAKKVKLPQALQRGKDAGRRFLTFTGISFHPYLSRYVNKLRKAGIDIEAVPVENTFFGTSVTVTGLLTGRDVIKSFSGLVVKGDTILVPDVVLRSEGDLFLDDISLHDIEEVLGAPAAAFASTPQGIVEAIAALS
jgi:putative radical SAM enzyme (TIGR03279 family)